MSAGARWVERYWSGEAGAVGRLATPLLELAEVAFAAGVRWRSRRYEEGRARIERAPIPVVSVGNLTVGGTGKTPISAELAARLRAAGAAPAIVSRGYGEDEGRVHDWLNPGIPVFVAARRIDAARRAAAAGCSVVVLDDGFQHRRLHRDLDVVLVAAESLRAAPRLLPRGRWREPPEALSRADLVVVTRKTASDGESRAVSDLLRLRHPGLRVARCHLAPGSLRRGIGRNAETLPLEALRGRPVLAVATLADPASFARQLEEAGASVELLALRDHAPLPPPQVRRLREAAGARPLVLTRKEAVKLSPADLDGVEVFVLEQEIRWDEGEAQLSALIGAFGTGKG